MDVTVVKVRAATEWWPPVVTEAASARRATVAVSARRATVVSVVAQDSKGTASWDWALLIGVAATAVSAHATVAAALAHATVVAVSAHATVAAASALHRIAVSVLRVVASALRVVASVRRVTAASVVWFPNRP